MKSTSALTALSAALSLGILAMSQPASAADGALTIYSGDFDAVSNSEGMPGGAGFALFRETRSFRLQSGDSMVSLGGLPNALDASSVVLKPRGEAKIRGQRFDFSTAGQDELLRRAIGQTVTVEQDVGGQKQVHTGTLLSTGSGLTLRLNDGRIKVLSSYASFELPRLPVGVVNEPTLNWSIASKTAGEQNFDLSYATAGLAWRAEYLINASGQGKDCKLSLEGAAMVVNRSGADFDNVLLTLVAGEPNRAQGGQPEMVMMAAAAPRAKMVMADAAPQAEASGEYQAYKLPNRGSLPRGSVQRLPLVDNASGVACERRYETNASFGQWQPPYPIIDRNFNATTEQEMPVTASLRFKNSKAAGLGMPLPAGRVRMFEGSDFLGESAIGHTAANQDLALVIGNVFDLNAKRTREDFQLDRSGRTMTETVKVVLSNAKKNAATVRVHEQLPRWSDWELVSSSIAHDKRGAQHISFDVPVPAEGEAVLTYTVRYRWAADVKIPN